MWGAELMRLLGQHDGFNMRFVTGDTQAGHLVADLYPHLAAAGTDQEFVKYEPKLLDDVALAFLALPHGQSMGMAAEILDRGKVTIDLAADFRLNDAGQYPAVVRRVPPSPPNCWNSSPMACPSCSGKSWLVQRQWRCPAAIPTSAALAIAPLVRLGLVQTQGDHRGRGQRGIRSRPSSRRPTLRFARSMRTSLPTACSTTATPRRSNRPPTRRCCSPPIWPR